MKKVGITLPEIKKRVETLIGKEIDMRVDCGRKRIMFQRGVIESVYQSVFTVKMHDHTTDIVSFTYTDILCGDLKIRKRISP